MNIYRNISASCKIFDCDVPVLRFRCVDVCQFRPETAHFAIRTAESRIPVTLQSSCLIGMPDTSVENHKLAAELYDHAARAYRLAAQADGNGYGAAAIELRGIAGAEAHGARQLSRNADRVASDKQTPIGCKTAVAHYVLIDHASGFIRGDVSDLQDGMPPMPATPSEIALGAAEAGDEARNVRGRTYWVGTPVSTEDDAYHVYRIDAEGNEVVFPVENWEDREAISTVRTLGEWVADIVWEELDEQE
jgi:hypothetical protein